MPHIEDVLLHSLTQDGDRYVFGAEVPKTAPDSDRWDCSELVEWSCARAGVVPSVPDGAYYQWQHTIKQGRVLSVREGVETRGALLFVGDGTGVGRNAITHVAWSLGDGTTIEARGSRWGVGSWPTASRFDFAGLIPGVDYSPGHGRLPQEDDMDATQDQRLKTVEERVTSLYENVNANLGPALKRIDAEVAGLKKRLDQLDDEIAAKVTAGVGLLITTEAERRGD